MAIRGKTVIQLFDAKTGEMTDEVEKENMVTNAVTNVLNGAIQAQIYPFFSSNSGVRNHLENIFKFPTGYDIAKALYGGLLIFSGEIEEGVDHIIPTVEEMKTFIGCANQHEGIVGDTFKGAINATESARGDNYVRFVWDFTTEQCNGDIASICLTSDCGGQIGYGFDALANVADCQTLGFIYDGMWDTTEKVEFNSSSIHSPMMRMGYGTSDDNGGYVSGDYAYYVYRDKAYKYNISKLVKNEQVGVGILDNFAFGKSVAYDEVITLQTYSNYIVNCVDEDRIYEYNKKQSLIDEFVVIKVSENANTEQIAIPTTNINLSIQTYVEDSSKHHYIKDAITNGYGVMYNDKLYILTGKVNNTDQVTYPNKMRMYVLAIDGSFVYKDIDVSNNIVSTLFGTTYHTGYLPVSYFRFFESVALVSENGTNGYKMYFVSEAGDVESHPFGGCASKITLYRENGAILGKNNTWLKEPWCSFAFGGNYFIRTIEILKPYLATINNQYPVLTKTADKTMKISYTLTME